RIGWRSRQARHPRQSEYDRQLPDRGDRAFEARRACQKICELRACARGTGDPGQIWLHPDLGSTMAETSIPRTRAAAHTPEWNWSADQRNLPLLIASVPLAIFLLLPLIALVLRISPAQLLNNLLNQQVAQAIWLSMITTLLSLTLTIVAGTPLAFLLARRRFRGRALMDTLIDLPMVLPPSVAGIALLMAFGRRGLLGQYFSAAGLEIAFTPAAVVLAQTFVAAPFYVK